MSKYPEQRRNFRGFVLRENMRHFTHILESEVDLAKRKITQDLILIHYEDCLRTNDGRPGLKTR